jgi:hypothetical protein
MTTAHPAIPQAPPTKTKEVGNACIDELSKLAARAREAEKRGAEAREGEGGPRTGRFDSPRNRSSGGREVSRARGFASAGRKPGGDLGLVGRRSEGME